jgi:hypothetical protein
MDDGPWKKIPRGFFPAFFLSRFRGMMNTPRLAAQFLGVAIRDTARLAARCFIGILPGCGLTPSLSPSEEFSPVIAVSAAIPAASPSFMLAPPAGSSSTPSPEDSGWGTLRPGLELRRILLRDETQALRETVALLRITPDAFSFDVAYDPQGKDLQAWQAATGAAAIINGGYFRREPEGFVPDGLIVCDGKGFGESYGDYAGMFSVGDTGPEVRWLKTTPYDPAEKLHAAVQSFPMLIQPGGQIGFPQEDDDGLRARRTVVARDRSGRILFLIAAQGWFTLRTLSVYLHESDLDLDAALNLDGGPSSGMLVRQPREIIPAQVLLPIVITVFSK